MAAPTAKLRELVDSKVARTLEAMDIPTYKAIRVAMLLANSGVRTADDVSAIPARSLSEFMGGSRRTISLVGLRNLKRVPLLMPSNF